MLAQRTSRRRGPDGEAQKQYLVKWRGLEYSDATWEDDAELTEEDRVRGVASR